MKSACEMKGELRQYSKEGVFHKYGLVLAGVSWSAFYFKNSNAHSTLACSVKFEDPTIKLEAPYN